MHPPLRAQLLREQVHKLKQQHKLSEKRLKASEARVAVLESNNAQLNASLADMHYSPDQATTISQLQQALAEREKRVKELSDQLGMIMTEVDKDRAHQDQIVRQYQARIKALEKRVNSAVSRSYGQRVGPMPATTTVTASGSRPGSQGVAPGTASGDAGSSSAPADNAAAGAAPASSGAAQPVRLPSAQPRPFYMSAYGVPPGKSPTASGRLATAKKTSDRSPSPPRGPAPPNVAVYQPGMHIPSGYPIALSPTASSAPRAYSPERPTWHEGTQVVGARSGQSAASMQMLGGQGSPYAPGGRGGSSSHPAGSGPAETVKAINSKATVTSRSVLPAIGGGPTGGSSGANSRQGSIGGAAALSRSASGIPGAAGTGSRPHTPTGGPVIGAAGGSGGHMDTLPPEAPGPSAGSRASSASRKAAAPAAAEPGPSPGQTADAGAAAAAVPAANGASGATP